MADIILKAVPPEVRKLILREQLKEKEKRGGQYSMSLTVFKIIKEWEQCYNSQKGK